MTQIMSGTHDLSGTGPQQFIQRDQPQHLSARSDAEIEWWFVQGVLQRQAEPALYFMAAFFQVRATGCGGPPAQMLLGHATDGAAPTLLRSWITPTIIDMHQAVARSAIAARFPARLADFLLARHMRSAERAARDHGIEVIEDRATVSESTLDISWRDFLLRQTSGSFTLGMMLDTERSGGVAELSLKPDRPWLCETGARLDPYLSPPYAYCSCPRLSISGTLDGRPVCGQAWIDRQWGSLGDGWFLTSRTGSLRPLGWDWLGLSLDSGAEVAALQQFSPGAGSVGDGCVIWFHNATAHRVDGGFPPTGQRLWTSPRTGVRYALERRLTLPDLDGDLIVSPIADDQEIPVFGAPAIWEGSVNATGRIGGQPVNGVGRLELFGYGYPDGLKSLVVRRMRREFAT